MNIELKNISVNRRISHETLCFVGDIYLDGKKVGKVENGGCGGYNYYEWSDDKAANEINEYTTKLHPELQMLSMDHFFQELANKQ